jgi:hypothetical protein
MKGIPALSKTTKAIALLLFLSSLIVIQGCSNSGSARYASHKVTMKRSGITNRFGIEERGKIAVFHYDGYNRTGERLKLMIENDKVTINDQLAGHLKQGDSVRIADEGIAINSLDFGQSKEYLAASLKTETAQTIK